MKYLKMVALVAVAAVGLTAFTAAASATTLTSPSGTAYTSTVEAKASSVKFTGSFVAIECSESKFDGTVSSHGEAVTAKMSLSSMSFTGCNYNFTVAKAGALEIHTDSAGVDGNGRVTWTGLEMTMHTSVGQCVYTSNVAIGTLDGSDTGNAEWRTENTSIPRVGGSFLCGSSSKFSANYIFTTPSTLSVD